MAHQVEITGITGGTGPFNIEVCDITNTYCANITSSIFVPPTLTFIVPSPFDSTTPILVKVIDSNGCEYFNIVECVTTPTPTPTPTLTPTLTLTPTSSNCLCIVFENSTIETLFYQYTDCIGRIVNSKINPGMVLYVCGTNPSGSEELTYFYNGYCTKGECPPLPTPTSTPTPTISLTSSLTPTPTPTTTSIEGPFNNGGCIEGNVYELPIGTGSLFTRAALSLVTPVSNVDLSNFNIPPQAYTVGFPGAPGLFEWFEILFDGEIYMPVTGTYNFRLCSDDGSILRIYNGLTLLFTVNNDGIHPNVCQNGNVFLTQGTYRFELDYFQGPKFQIALQLYWTVPGFSEEIIPVDAFVCPG